MAINMSPMDDSPSVMGGLSLDELEQSLPDNASSGFETLQPLDVDAIGDPIATDSASGEGIGVIQGDAISSPKERKQKLVKMTGKMKKAMNRLKDHIASFPAMWFRQKASVHPEWSLNQDEEELISESINFALEILDIEFMIEPVSLTLTSIWWIIAYPFATIGLIWFTHSDAVKAAHPEDFPDKETK